MSSSGPHPFEKAGLGLAPFRVIGVEERRGPITYCVDGVEVTAGAPGQAMGCCAYCYTGIAECWEIESSDGKRFVVGSSCVLKTGDKQLAGPVRRHATRLRKERERVRIEKATARLAQHQPTRAALAAQPSPNTMRRGETALDWALWMLDHAGHTGQLKATRYVEKEPQ